MATAYTLHFISGPLSKLSRSLSRGGEEPNGGTGKAAGEPAVERRGWECWPTRASKNQRKRPSGVFKIPTPPLSLWLHPSASLHGGDGGGNEDEVRHDCSD